MVDSNLAEMFFQFRHGFINFCVDHRENLGVVIRCWLPEVDIGSDGPCGVMLWRGLGRGRVRWDGVTFPCDDKVWE